VLRRVSERTPLRIKLITSVLTLVVLALVAIGVSTVFVLQIYLTTQQDSILRNIASIALPQYAASSKNPAGSLYSFNDGVSIGVQLPGTPIVNPGVGPNASMPSPPAPAIPTNQAWATAHRDELLTVPSQSGPHSWRVIVEPFTFTSVQGTTENATFIVAYDLGDISAVVRRLVAVELIVGAAIVVVLAAVGVGVVQANLRPLNDIELTAGQIARGHLEHRIPELDPRTEIGSLGHSLNAMLSQIEQAFHAQAKSEQAAHESEERMRRFIADASHELRTPLTTIRGFAEYYRQRGGVSRTPFTGSTSGGSGGPGASPGKALWVDPEGVVPPGKQNSDLPGGSLSGGDIDRLMHRLESEASRMGLLVEDLLQLARLDQQRPLDLGPVDLLTLAADAVQDARIVAPDRSVDLITGRGAFIIEGDEPRLRQVLANLVNNAIAHTPKGTSIRVRIGSDVLPSGQPAPSPGGTTPSGSIHSAFPGDTPGPPTPLAGPAVVLDVEDDGPGMTEDQAQRVFERFYRADAARNRASGGTGLGLAIVAGLVEAHGGTVSVRTAPGQGADFQVRLPLSPDALGGDEEDED
jgi:two-component system OmpR family sensor kinase